MPVALYQCMKIKKHSLVLPILLTFLGYCGDGKNNDNDQWIKTGGLENLVAPSAVSASCQASGKIKVTWDAHVDTSATHLQVFRKAVTEEDFVMIDEVAVDAGIFSNTVPNNVYYTYRVKAVARNDEGDLMYIADEFSATSNQARATLNCLIIIDEASEETFVPTEG